MGGESIPYVAGWGEDGALEAIREYAQTIDTIARRIDDAVHDQNRRRHRRHDRRRSCLTATETPCHRAVG